MKTRNYLELTAAKRELEQEVRNLMSEIQSHIGYRFIAAALKNRDDWFSAHAEADALVEELNQRDDPLDYPAIKSIFEFSGFVYTEDHILACHPNSQEQINEQIRYYQE